VSQQPGRMSNLSFRAMTATMAVIDWVYPHIDARVQKFGLAPGMTVVDYGCGPGRYTIRFARAVGPNGKVYAVDTHPLAIRTVQEKRERLGLSNVVPVLAVGYDSGLPDHVADVVCAIDMFFAIPEPTTFLRELRRIVKPDGFLVLDDGHQSRARTKEKLLASGCWTIWQETRDHLKCRPVNE
jgi:ubiquinone/menaquinone biosynthesis C-methylase UbiE